MGPICRSQEGLSCVGRCGHRNSHCPLSTGTGKTVVGFHIVYWFHRSNQEQMPTGNSPSREEQLGGPCVLYCGPSNKSVDVLGGVLGMRYGTARGCWALSFSLTSSLALGLLLRKKTEMRPLRVYGEQAEATEFPLPGVSRSLFGKTSQEGRPNQSLRYDPSVCAGMEARGPPLARGSPRLCLPGALPFTTGSAKPPTHMQQRSGNLMPSFEKGKYSQRRILWCKWWSWRWGPPICKFTG